MHRPRIHERLGFSMAPVPQQRLTDEWNMQGAFSLNQQRTSFNSFNLGNLGSQGRSLAGSLINLGSIGSRERNFTLDMNSRLSYNPLEHSVAKTVPSVLDLDFSTPVS
jgi:hypothetical protein